MYPTLYHAFLDLFGWELAPLKLVNSFGFFVALAFVAASAVLKREMQRLTALGHFQSRSETVVVGEGPHWMTSPHKGSWDSCSVGRCCTSWSTHPPCLTAPPPLSGFCSRHVLWGVLGAAALVAWRYWEVRRDMLLNPRGLNDVQPGNLWEASPRSRPWEALRSQAISPA